MKNENFAERLFCDLKNAGIKIEKPTYVESGARFGKVNCKQLVLFGNKSYDISNGPNIGIITELPTKTFTEAYNELLKLIKDYIENGNVKFYSLVIPRNAVMETRIEEFETVVTRYIKDYAPMSDEIVERFDILIEKVNYNA